MTYLKTPFTLGKLKLASNVFCAPLAGCSDVPFRRMAAFYRPGLLFCEMVKIDALVRREPGTYQMLRYEESMRPIGAQVCGSKPQLAAQAAKIVEELGFDVLDLNCGCPVDKVTKDGSGSGMLKTPELIAEMLAEMVAAVKIPVTLKMRTGWDDTHIVAPQIVQIAEEAGASAVCIHGRTREQAYRGEANLDIIKECKQAAKRIPVIGNGDIFDPPRAERMFAYTGCDAILLARGMLGQPWLVEDIYHHFLSKPLPMRTAQNCRDHFLTHLNHIVETQPERKAVLDLRRIGCWYLKKFKGMCRLREALNKATTLAEVHQVIQSYPWEEEGRAGAPG